MDNTPFPEPTRLTKSLRYFRRYPWFFIIGGVGTVANIGITYLLTELLGWWYLFSFIVSSVGIWSASFLAHSALTFAGHPRTGYRRQYVAYMAYYVIFGSLNFFLVWVATSLWGLYYLASVAIVTLAVSFLTFAVNRRAVFNYTD